MRFSIPQHLQAIFTGAIFALASTSAWGGAGICITADDGCFAPNTVQVRMAGSTDRIVGAQFCVKFDTTALELIDISPGQSCDPTSPFALELFRTEMEDGGWFYAVGVGVASSAGTTSGELGTSDPATLACFHFRALRTANTDLCLRSGDEPFLTVLVNDQGHSVAIDNTATCSGSTLPDLDCASAMVSDECICASNSEDCAGLDEQCITGFCNASTGHCDRMPVNEGLPCDDGDACTKEDACRGGRCTGTGCRNPSLCIDAIEGCIRPVPGQIANMVIRLGEGDPVVTGAQFSIDYDPAALLLVDISPGSTCNAESPFSLETFEAVDVFNGHIFYAVSVPLGGTGSTGPETMACLRFEVLSTAAGDVCLFNDINPRTTALVDDRGQRVQIFNGVDCPTQKLPPNISCSIPCLLIPTVNEWGMVCLTLCLMVGAKIAFRSRSGRAF